MMLEAKQVNEALEIRGRSLEIDALVTAARVLGRSTPRTVPLDRKFPRQ